MSIEGLKAQFEQFIFEMSDSLADLKSQVQSFEKPELLPLDFSWESLERIEAAYKLVLDNKVSVGDKDIFTTRVGRYLGETLRIKLGGHWDMCDDPKDVCYGLPWITGLSGLDDFGWSPLAVVFNYRNRPRSGLLKKSTKRIIEAVEINQNERLNWFKIRTQIFGIAIVLNIR